MVREVDERKKRAALRKLRKAQMLAEQGLGPPLSDWEREFLEEVEGRIEKFGSAFADPMKGADGEALSSLQQAKLREIDKKARGNASRGLQTRKPMGMKRKPLPRIRNDETEQEDAEPTLTPPEPPIKSKPTLVPASSLSTPEPGKITRLRQTKPKLTIIEGGAPKSEN